MLNINPAGKKIIVYPDDTDQNIINRIANALSTLPRYLQLPDILPRRGTVEVFDLKKEAANQSYGKWRKAIGSTSLNEDELVKLFITQMDTSNEIKILLLENELKPISLKFDIDNFIKRDLDNFKKKINAEFEEFSNKVKRDDAAQKLIKDLTPKESTNFQIEQLTYDFYTSLDLSPIEIFDKLYVNSNVPFATVSDFYKITENFTPPSTWANLSTDVFLLLKLLTKTKYTVREKITPDDIYNDVIIFNDPKAVFRLKLSNKNTESDRERFISTVLDSIDEKKIEIYYSRQSGIFGKYFVKDVKLNNVIFADMAMNDILFSRYITINESVKATKKKTGISFYFRDPNNPENGRITVTLSNRIRDKNDIETRDLFPIGTNYIRLKIRNAPTIYSVENLIKIFGKLLNYYDNKSTEVFKIYKQYFPSFQVEKVEKVEKKIKSKKQSDEESLREIAPEVFIAGFSRAVCQHKPKIIDQKEADLKGIETIIFPKSNVNEKGENVTQRHYYCPSDKKGFNYIGVKPNKMQNKEEFPVIPCCFQEDQKTKKNSNYNKYISDKLKIGKKEKKTVKTGLSTLGLKEIGGITEDLDKLFYNIDPMHKFQRYGVTRSTSSMLECVLQALDIEFSKLSKEQRLEQLKKIRNSEEILNRAYLCKQQLYDRNISDIKQMIRNSETYLDPKLFIHMISQIYKCKIYVFSRKYKSKVVELLVPRNIYGLYRIYRSDWPSIILFENYGNEFDNLEYPQCELISRSDQKKPFPELYHTDQKFNKDIETTYRKLFTQLDTQVNIEMYSKGIPFAVSQYIDNFGKTRVLQTKEGYHIMTSPLEILNGLKLYEGSEIKPIELDWQTLSSFIKNQRMTVQDIYKDENGKVAEIRLRYQEGNIDFYVPVSPKTNVPEEINELDVYTQRQFLQIGNNIIYNFKYCRKMAKCITSNLYHIYSKFKKLLEEEFKKSSDEIKVSLEDFIDKNIKLNKKHKYPLIPPIDIKDGNGILQNGKLVINDEELLKRLMWQLRLTQVRNYKILENYRNIDKVVGYYEDIEDFRNLPGQIIIKGSNLIKKWFIVNIANFRIYNSIQKNIYTYFFQNKQIMGDDKIYIANTRLSLEDGFVEFYNTDRHLIFTLITPQGERYNINGDDTTENIKVVGYKKDGENRYVFMFEYSQIKK